MDDLWASIIVNTYNRAEFLRNCLTGYLHQTAGGFEIVVADDGSTDHTARVVREFAAQAPFVVRHVCQEHVGHRRTAILNKGISVARAPYILFTDCDAIPAVNLLEMHRRHQSAGRMLCGGYVRLTMEETSPVNPEFIQARRFEAFLTLERRRSLRWIHWKNRFYIALGKKSKPHNMGLNYSVARDALVAINGYDEEFRGWGGADGDVRRRLRRIGVWPKSVWSQAIVYHQFHPPEPTKLESKDRNRARARRERAPVFCEKGLDQHLQKSGDSAQLFRYF